MKKTKKKLPVLQRVLAKQQSADSVLEALTKAVVAEYQGDPTIPSIVISRLVGDWYVSIKRYRQNYAREGFIVEKAIGSSLHDVVIELALQWLGGTDKTTARDALRIALGR